jgi:TRAP-type uncharacterized transport system substrate-binding protein
VSYLSPTSGPQGLAVLWDEYLQLVVNPDLAKKIPVNLEESDSASVERVRQLLKGQVIHLGRRGSQSRPGGSASWWVASALLTGLGLEKSDYKEASEPGDDQASDGLIKKRIGAAFFLAGTPTPAVETALLKGCRLLPLRGCRESAQHYLSGPQKQDRPLWRIYRDILDKLVEKSIPPDTYESPWSKNTPSAIPTLGGKALLVAAARVPREQGEAILRAIFDAQDGETGQEDLLRYHEAAEQIDFLESLDQWRTPPDQRKLMTLPFHPGAEAFWRAESGKPKIAAGPLLGTSFRLAVQIATALDARGMPARVIHTTGSEKSMNLLSERKDVELALVQNDVAARVYEQKKIATTQVDDPGKQSQLLGFLYPEAVHVLTVQLPPDHLAKCKYVRKQPKTLKELLELLRQQAKRRTAQDPEPQMAIVNDVTPSRLGEEMPGDREGEVLRFYEDLQPQAKEIPIRRLSLSQIQNRLLLGQIPAALVISSVPMEAVQQLCHPESYPRLHRLAHPRCPYCGLPIGGGPLRVAVLPLDAAAPSVVPTVVTASSMADSNAASQDKIRMQQEAPDSIKGLAARNRFFEAFDIPPTTYASAQRVHADTVAIKVVLVCRNDCPRVRPIMRALLEDEVRLRSVVRGLNLHDPLPNDEPSIPLHRVARAYYEDQGVLKQLPSKIGFFQEQVLPALVTAVVGVVLGAWGKDWILYFFSRRQRDYQSKLLDTYFTGKKAEEKIADLEQQLLEIVKVYRKELKPRSADEMDKMVRELLQRLDKDRAGIAAVGANGARVDRAATATEVAAD